jgi:predicted ATP-dependent endonuclease of OLD family
VSVSITGFRRFESASVRVREPIISVVGKNEAGKSSFLQALEKLGDNKEIEKTDKTRRISTDTKIEATFSLEESDKKALKDIKNGENIDQCTITKKENDNFDIEVDPEPPHDIKPRKEAHKKLNWIIELPFVKRRASANQKTGIRRATSETKKKKNSINTSRIEDTIQTLENLIENVDEEGDNGQQIKSIKILISELEELVEHESNCAPETAKKRLLRRKPEFLLFKEEDRGLKSTYDLNKIDTNNPPQALENLCGLANLNLQKLEQAIESENIPQVDDLREEANKELKREFAKIWVREDVVPEISTDGSTIHILVRTEEKEKRSKIGQRSEGLRWFIALRSFLEQQKSNKKPIILVDEVETHLSYDAQANLIDFLETEIQNLAQKVIYTTHSAGCLPSDIGTGVRPVIPTGEGERSKIENGFWSIDKKGEGFTPLMIVMGLSPVAFSVARNSLIAEGPSECILLPTLLREVSGEDTLAYQVAPGASNVPREDVYNLVSESGRTSFILDGDDGGDEIKKNLQDGGVEEGRIKSYRELHEDNQELILEDLIEPEVLVGAINEELREWQSPQDSMEIDDLDRIGCWDSVEAWCEEHELTPPRKVGVSQRLVEKSNYEGMDIVDSDREHILEELHDWAMSHFNIP